MKGLACLLAGLLVLGAMLWPWRMDDLVTELSIRAFVVGLAFWVVS